MADELIYKVKLELDQKSREDLENQLKKVESSARKSSGGNAGGDSEKEVSVLKELKQQLASYREELAKVNQLTAENGGATGAMRDVQTQLGSAIRDTSAQIQEANKGYADQNTVLSTIPQTYNDLVEQNRALSLAMREVPLNDTTERLDSLKKQYLENNVRLKEFDASIGNNQRNVGNYSSALDGTVDTLREMSTAFAVVQGPLGPLAGRINSFATFLNKMSERTKESNKQQTMFGKVLSGNIPFIQTSASALTAKGVAAKGANAGIGLLNIGLKGLRLTLLTLGLPAIAFALLSISQAFTRTEEGAQKLRVITAGFNATLEVFRDILSAVGRNLIKAFEDPQQAVKDLWQAIQTNLVNRFLAVPKMFVEGFDIIAKGAQYASKVIQGLFDPKAAAEAVILYGELGKEIVDFGNAVGQFLSGIEDPLTKLVEGAAKLKEEIDADAAAAKALQDRMNDVLVTERELGVERAKQNRDLQEARVIARDMEMDAQSRLEAINKVAKAEIEMAEKELANERERLAIMQAQAELSDTDEKTKQAIAEQQEKVFGLEAASLEKLMRLGRDRLAVERQIREENVRRARFAFEMESAQQDILNDKLRNRLKEEGRLREALENDLNRIVDERAQEENRLREVYLTEFLNQKFTQEEASRMAEEKARIEMDKRVFDAEENLRAQRIAEQRSADAFDRGLAEQRKNFAIKQAQDEFAQRGMLLKAALVEELHTTEGQERLKEEIRSRLEKQFRDQGLEPAEAERRAKEQAEEESAEIIYKAKMNFANLEREQRLQIAEQISSGLSAINSAFFKDSKELAVASAIMDTYAAVTKALTAPPGWPLNVAGVISAGATGMANVKKILSTKLGDKNVSATTTSQPNISTSFGLVDVGTNAPIAEQVAGMSGLPRQNMNPTFVFTGDLDPEVMAIKVNQGSNAISSRTLGVGI